MCLAAMDLLPPRTFTARTAFGVAVFVGVFESQGPARRVDAVVPGFADHGGPCPHRVSAALSRAEAVGTLDTRGHGLTERPRGHVEGFHDFHLDVDRFLTEVRKPFAGVPVVLWGHSMGGLIARSYLTTGFGPRHAVSAAVVTAPALRMLIPAPPRSEALEPVLSRVAPAFAPESEVAPDTPSHDLDVGRRSLEDPHVHPFGSFTLYLAILAEGARLLSCPADDGVPTLLAHGLGETAIDAAAPAHDFRHSPLIHKAHREYFDARHEPHDEPIHADLFRDAFAFVDARLRA